MRAVPRWGSIAFVLLGGCSIVFGYPEPAPEICDNGDDDDRDGRHDCDDDECTATAACDEHGERCGDGLDSDGDMLVDCRDPGCDPVCGERDDNCTDGRDNDADALTDGLDPQCWWTADTSLDRCSAVGGETIVLGAEPGLDWNLSSDFPPAMVIVGGERALVAEAWYGAAASIASVPLGAVDGTRIEMGLVFGGYPEDKPGLPSEVRVTIGDPARGAVEVRVYIQPTWTGGLVYLASEGAGAEPYAGDIEYDGGYRRVALTMVIDGATLRATARPEGGVDSDPIAVAIPAGWARDEPLPISWYAWDAAGVSGAEITRPRAARCGSMQPFETADRHRVLSAAWSDSGEICVSLYLPDTNTPLLLSGRAPPSGELPLLEPTSGPELRIVALAYEAGSGRLRAIGHELPWWSPPQLLEAPGCAGPWTVLGQAFPGEWSWPGNIRAMRLVAPGEDELLLATHEAPEPLQVARGDATVRGSFALASMHDVVGWDQRLGGAVIGDQLVTLTLGESRTLVISAELDGGRCGSPICGDVVFAGAFEATTFDHDGFPPIGSGIRWPFATLAMDPSIGDPWRGLLVYEGCVGGRCRLGMTWLRIAP